MARFAEESVRQVEESAALVEVLHGVHDSPRCIDVKGVNAACLLAAEQVFLLSQHHVAMPAVHVEYARQAVDSAGKVLIDNPPLGGPGERLSWVSKVVDIQLAPLRAFQTTLRKLALTICPTALQALLQDGQLSAEAQHLLAAITWILQPGKQRDSTLLDLQLLIAGDPVDFMKTLAAWDAVRDAKSTDMRRAREMLSEIWNWIVGGCERDPVLVQLCSWAALAAALNPLQNVGQRLVRIHSELQKGLASIDAAAEDEVQVVVAKAWDSTIFMLDAAGDRWWWLSLIRPALTMDPPWIDGEDGAVCPVKKSR